MNHFGFIRSLCAEYLYIRYFDIESKKGEINKTERANGKIKEG